MEYNYNTSKLLTVNKTSDYLIATLYLAAQKNIMNAPYYGIEYDKSLIDISKVNLCKKATNGCATSCLYHQGILKNSDFAKNKIKIARIKRTFKFLLQRNEFFIQLVKEIKSLQKKALKDGLTLAVQLNGTSDILWEKESFEINAQTYENLMTYFKDVQFFDYTKYDILKNRKTHPSNYHLTYSRAGLHKGTLVDDWQFLQNLLDKEIDISVIFNKKMKDTMLENSSFLGYKLIDADLCNCRLGDVHHRENHKGLILVHEAAKKTDFNNSGFIIQSPEELNKYFPVAY